MCLGFRVWGLGLIGVRVRCFGLSVWGLGLSVWLQCLGGRVSMSRVWVRCLGVRREISF